MTDTPITILLVEDSDGDAHLIEALLDEAAGSAFRVEHADRLAAGLAHLRAGGIAAVLLDLSLPDSQGLDTFLQIYSCAPDIPVVILTGLDDDARGETASRAGAQDYLVKGEVTGRKLARALRNAIERHQLFVALRDQALIDPLTRLSNRRGFCALAEQQLCLAARTQQPCLLFFLDVDDLKPINDAHGHLAGDRALQEVADLLRSSFRTSDVLGRLGGDEFAALASETGADAAPTLVARLRQNLAERPRRPRPHALSFSLGMAAYDPQHPASLDDLLTEADARMYAAKAARRGDLPGGMADL